MAVGSGLGGYIAIGQEETYGTVGSLDRFPEVRNAKLKSRKHIVQGTGLAAGRLVDPGARRQNVWEDAGGSIEMDWLSNNMLLILQHGMGGTGSPAAIDDTAAYQLIATLGVLDFGGGGPGSITVQEVVPDAAGTLHPYTYHGCKISEIEWTCERTGILTTSLTLDAQYVEEETEVVEFSGTPGQVDFGGQGMTLDLGPLGDEVAVDGIKKWSVKITRALAMSRIYVGSQYKKEATTNGLIKLSGSFDADLVDTTVKEALADVYASQSPISLLPTWTGPEIATSGHNNSLAFAIPEVFLTGDTPELDGPEIVSGSFPFEALLDPAGDNPMTATAVTADTAF